MTECPDITTETTLTAMTYNVYVGSSTEALLGTMNPAEGPARVAEMHATVLASDFEGRAAAIARIVKESQPHLIGLQEILLLRMQAPGNMLVNGAQDAETVTLDFLELLLGALQAEGMSYVVAGKVENFDIEMPMAVSATELVDVRVTDFDVILARSDVAVASSMAATYSGRAADSRISGSTFPAATLPWTPR